jgi:hypothetical protein
VSSVVDITPRTQAHRFTASGGRRPDPHELRCATYVFRAVGDYATGMSASLPNHSDRRLRVAPLNNVFISSLRTMSTSSMLSAPAHMASTTVPVSPPGWPVPT